MSVTLSVIIPAYNIENYIGKCLDSILAQSYQDYEIVVVNDGSTDGTGKVLDEYAGKDTRIKVIHKKNEGVSIARNTGINASCGKYILFWDGDDFAEPETCSELLDIMQKEQVDSVVYGYYRYADGKVTETCLPYFDKALYEGEEILQKMVPQFVGLSYDKINAWLRGEDHALYVENPALWRIMVSRKIIEENKLRFDSRLKVGEDTVFISEYLSCAKRVYVQQKCYYYLVTRETSTIFVYEKNIMQKYQGKVNLLDGREDLTKRIKERKGVDITDTWAGIAMMSAIQIGFMMAKKHPEVGFSKRFSSYMNYLRDKRVQAIIKNYQVEKVGGVKRIPFVLLKLGLYRTLFGAIMVLNLIGYEFERK